jgi:cytochrome c oxidase subunit 2
MSVELYERIWMWAATALLVLFVGAIVAGAAFLSIAPPSHVETLDPTTIATHPEFGDPRVNVRADGSVVASVRADMFAFSPDPIEVPAHQPVTFRVTSGDVIHGFHVVGTNANTMAVPGYVSQFTYTFRTPGQYAIACNEYCGVAHHYMVGTLIVRE